MTDWAGALAIDLGSSHGRAYWGRLIDDRLEIEHLGSVPNGPVRVGPRWYVDLLRLFDFMPGMLRAAVERAGDQKFTVGVCTWGVDYVFLDARGELAGPMHHYRDPRTDGIFEDLFELVPKEEIYAATGNMFLPDKSLASRHQTNSGVSGVSP